MALSYKDVKPLTGGGLGDCKVKIIELAGAYESGGLDVGIKNDPLFAVATGGYIADFSTGKLVLKANVPKDATPSAIAVAEVPATTVVTGVKVLIVVKGTA